MRKLIIGLLPLLTLAAPCSSFAANFEESAADIAENTAAAVNTPASGHQTEMTPPATATIFEPRRVTTPYPQRDRPGSIPRTNMRSTVS